MRTKYGFALGIAAVLLVGCTSAIKPTAEPSPDAAVTSPTPTASALAQASPMTEQTGTFVSGEHPTQGTVRLVTQNGQSSIELGEDFSTFEMGPDLVVILHRSDDVIGSTEPPAYPLNEGDYVILAPLKQFKGAQSYPIPSNINLADYRSAGIWCRQFNATFGAAVLNP